MNTMELKVAMMRNSETSKTLADVIKKSRVTFDKKMFGLVAFDIGEVLALASELSLTLQDVNVIFFDGKLPDGNNSDAQAS